MTIELKGVTKRVGAETHIFDTSVTMAETGFNVLLGETRAGKTTLIPARGRSWPQGTPAPGGRGR